MRKALIGYNQVSEVFYSHLEPSLLSAMKTLALDFVPQRKLGDKNLIITQKIHDPITLLKHDISLQGEHTSMTSLWSNSCGVKSIVEGILI